MQRTPPRPASDDVICAICEALERAAWLEARAICVEINGTRAILRGTVRSAFDRALAESAAQATLGVERVDSFLEVQEERAAELAR